jgi:hypothetical protein
MEYERLTYREISARLGISCDAARMKCKRECSAGRWRMVPGNHPNDTVHVDVPVGTLPDEPPPKEETPPKPDAHAGDAVALALLTHCEHLTDQLLEEKDKHAKTLAELVASETREIGQAEEIRRAQATIAELRARIARRGWLKSHQR